MVDDRAVDRHGAWNPGMQSQVPKELLHLATIFRPENVFTNAAAAAEMAGLTGIAPAELVAFRPERLALHELLIRVTADFAVPAGRRIEDLGINFRDIVRLLSARYVVPHSVQINAVYRDARQRLQNAINSAVDAAVPELPAATAAVSGTASSGFFSRLLPRRKPLIEASRKNSWGPQQIARLEGTAGSCTEPLQQLACRTVARVMAALFRTHGEAWGTRELIVTLSTDIASNAYCGDAIGRELEPLLWAAAEQEGYRRLPRQECPVVINTKGASASGKSTLRPLHQQLADAIGVNWADFALISPDIWRKQLLDYAALGGAYKYAGAFTGEEVQIIDQKLDRYMALKHQRGEMPHLLIDRFRFDSFAADSNEAGSNLLTRFGQTVYLFFVITPPELLVERAWKRGLEFGRYKAVDDTLAHSVEAYTGFPDVFFTWARRSDKHLQFEFLDNTVNFGDRPRTVAFGDHDTFNVLDVNCILNIERYGRINVDAANPEMLYADAAVLAAEKNTRFFKRCIREFRNVNFADQASGRIYLQIASGALEWVDPAALQSALADANTHAALVESMPAALGTNFQAITEPRYLRVDRVAPTLGQWGTGAAATKCPDLGPLP